MKRRFLLLSIAFLSCPLLTMAASEIVWEDKTMDFGEVSEDEGELTGEFRFINGGDEDLTIVDVRASCGCTSVKFPEEVIAPGETSSIIFHFNPEGRIGNFEKNLKVYSGVSGSYEKLTFKGKIKAGAKTVANRYPFEKAGLRFETDHLKIGELKRGERRHGFIGIYNATEEDKSPVFNCSEAGLEISVVPADLKPGESGMIALYLNTEKYPEGFKEIKITASDETGLNESEEIKVSFIILPKGMGSTH